MNNQKNIKRRPTAEERRKHRRAVKRNRFILATVLLMVLAFITIGCVSKKTDGDKEVQNNQGIETPVNTPEATPTPVPTPTPTPDPMEGVNVTWNTDGRDGYDYLVAINRAADTVTVYEKDENGNYLKPFKAMVCSTGDATPLGEYNTIEQYRWRALFGNVYGQYAVRIVDHILFHSVPYYSMNEGDMEYQEFNKLGTPASMGCIRLQVKDVKWIYDNCPIGTPVVLYDDAENPGPLGKPDFKHIDVNDPATRGWDPTDPNPNNPWNK